MPYRYTGEPDRDLVKRKNRAIAYDNADDGTVDRTLKSWDFRLKRVDRAVAVDASVGSNLPTASQLNRQTDQVDELTELELQADRAADDAARAGCTQLQERWEHRRKHAGYRKERLKAKIQQNLRQPVIPDPSCPPSSPAEDSAQPTPGAPMDPNYLHRIAVEWTRDIARKGAFVFVPLETPNTDNPFLTLNTIAATAAGVVTATGAMQSDGIAFADLQLLGAVTHVTARSQASMAGIGNMNVHFSLDTLSVDGGAPEIYAPQVGICDQWSGDGTYCAGTLAVKSARVQAEIERNNVVNADVTVRSFSGATNLATAINYQVAVILVCQVLRDKIAARLGG